MATSRNVVCETCRVRVPANRPKLLCDICNKIKHFRCQKLTKSDAELIINSRTPWSCQECVSSILPVNAVKNNNNNSVEFKVQCTSCMGWCYSQNNARTCGWCENTVHSKCFRNDLGCLKCCENLIPGYYTTSYELNNDYSRLNNMLYNPYDRLHFTNQIGELIDNQDQYNEYWSEISNFLIKCQYKQQKHVTTASPNELKVFSLNIRSLVKNIAHLKEEIDTFSKYDILCFNETNCTLEKLPNGITDLLLDHFYEPIVQDPIRKSGLGGGLAMYINKRVCDPENIEIFQAKIDISDTSGEFQFVKIHNCKGFNKTKIIANIYRSPNRSTENFIKLLDGTMRNLERHSRKHIVAAGDFNVNLLRHDNDIHCQNLVETMAKYGFVQIAARPTRITDHSATLIDHVYTNDIHNTLSCNVLTVDISDHLATLTTVSLGNISHARPKFTNNPNVNEATETRTFNEANNAVFEQLIHQESWEEVFTLSDADSQYNKLSEIYTKHYNAAYPLKNNRNRRKNERLNPKPWILPWLEDACARKQDLYHKSVKYPTLENTSAYKKMDKFCVKHKKIAKDKYFKKYFETHKDNSKKQWQMINNLLNRKVKSREHIKLKNLDGTISSSSSDVASKFNEYFSNIASNIKTQIRTREVFDPGGFQEFLHSPSQNSVYIKPTVPTEVHSVIKSFKNKATLDTKIGPLKLANSSYNFTSALSKVINSSFNQGVFPSALKLARVVPIHKDGKKTDVSNYRPISLLSSFSKIYEKLMHTRILGFLDGNGSLQESQYGFRPGRSCEHALLNAQNEILHALNKKEIALLLLIDFSKAFDVIEHPIMLKKLEHYGIRGIALEWFKSYLNNREQFVTINNTDSPSKPIEYGVPQGSILGPLLFVIYINDLPEISVIAKFILYADDANIIVTGRSIDEAVSKINEVIAKLIKWVDSNGLALNLKKTIFMVFSRQRIDLDNVEIFMAGTKIERKTEARFLGVIMDDKLTWASHIKAVRIKMARYIGIMYKIKGQLPMKVRIQLYHSFVQSHLNFCSLVWGFTSKTHIDSLFRSQKQGIRAIMPGYVNYQYKDGVQPSHTKSSFHNNCILTVHGLIVKNALILMHKVKHFPRSLPNSVLNMFPNNIPNLGSDHTSSAAWLSVYGNMNFTSSIFYKGPLLAICDVNVDITTLPTLFSIKLYKKSTNCKMLEMQNMGNNDEEWPNFLLHNIHGLRRSPRTAIIR